MIRFTFHVECGDHGIIFGMEPPEYTKPQSASGHEELEGGMAKVELLVIETVSKAARVAVDTIAKTIADKAGIPIDVAELDGPINEEFASGFRKRVIGEEQDEQDV